MMKQLGFPFSHGMSQSCIEEYWADDIRLLYPAFNVEPFVPMQKGAGEKNSQSHVNFPQQSGITTWDTLLH